MWADPAGTVTVTLSFENVPMTSVKASVHEAHDIVDEKSVLLEKLGKARWIAEAIIAAGDYIGEVGLLHEPDLWLRQAQLPTPSFILLPMRQSKPWGCCTM